MALEGSGTTILSAFVEIIFDNLDSRFPTGHEELILRRTIGLMKDDYSIDHKPATKSDVLNVLEAGGFSRSNPYYIVPQGRITALTVAKDHERLQLIKEVAGTKIYESRRTESLNIIEDTTLKIDKVDELLNFINDRLKELDEEKSELKEFQEFDSERRSLEYTLLSRELEEINNISTTLEDSEHGFKTAREKKLEDFINNEKKLQHLKSTLEHLRNDVNLKTKTKFDYEQEFDDLIKSRAQLEILTESAGDDQKFQNDCQQQLTIVVDKIRKHEDLIAQIEPKLESQLKLQSEIQLKLATIETRISRLQSLSGRSKQFKNKKARDNWLESEIKELTSTLEKTISLREEMKLYLDEVYKESEDINSKISHLRKSITDNDALTVELTKYNAMKAKLDELHEQRKALWRESARTTSIIVNTETELQNISRLLRQITDKNTFEGLETCRKIHEQKKIRGYFGPISELFEVDEKYITAVDVAAGPSILYIVVEDDNIASQFIELMKSESSGRMTFIPLNKMTHKEPPSINFNDVIPLIKKLKFEDHFLPALEQVFSKSVLCPNIETAANFAREYNVNAVTLQGYKADKKGAVSGGYHDVKMSRYKTVKAYCKLNDELKELKIKMESLQERNDHLDLEITSQVSQMKKNENKRKAIQLDFQKVTNELTSLSRSEAVNRDLIKRKDIHLAEIKRDIESLNLQIESSKKELKSPFSNEISRADEELLDKLTKESESLKKELLKEVSKFSKFENEKSLLDNELRNSLYITRDEVMASLSAIGSKDDNAEKQTRKSLEKCKDNIETINEQIVSIIKEIKLVEKKRDETFKKVELLEDQQKIAAEELEQEQREYEVNIGKKSLLIQQKSKVSRSIRELGVLPAEAFDKYRTSASEKILKQLHKTKDKLSKYSHVNKQAYEQYNSFTKQQAQLNERRKELSDSLVSINELVAVLDHRKDEALERTFKQVSKNFTDVFEKLVPAGVGKLVMQRKNTSKSEEEFDENYDESSLGDSKGGMQNFIGVAISVSFNSKNDEQQRIQQLSGGQKSLCALALIFAIQKCDPAPFYLFDEIDANLDAQYRLSLADMLKEMSEIGQFICTTFRPEQIQVAADKFYGVYFDNKVSSIQVVEKSVALDFIVSEARS